MGGGGASARRREARDGPRGPARGAARSVRVRGSSPAPPARRRHETKAKPAPTTPRRRSRSQGGGRRTHKKKKAATSASSGSTSASSQSGSARSKKQRKRDRLRELEAQRAARRQERWELSCVRWFYIIGLPVILPGTIAMYFMFRRARSAHPWISWPVYWEAFCVWLFHELGFRRDEFGRDLFAALPGSTGAVLFPLKLWLRLARFLSRLWVEHKFYAAPPGRLHRAMSRLAFFDNALVRDDVEQVVVLGSGLASYGFNEAYLGKRVHKVFELNTRPAHASKKQLMSAAGINARHVTPLSSRKALGDSRRWLIDLTLAGFDLEATTLFLVNDDMWTWKAESAEKFLVEVGEVTEAHPLHLVAFPYADESLVAAGGWFSRRKYAAYTFGIPEGPQKAKYLRRLADLKPLEDERLDDESTGLLLCTSPLNVPEKALAGRA